MVLTELEQEFYAERDKASKESEAPEQKSAVDLGDIIYPVYEDIPPAPRAGLFLSEGLRSWAFIAISAIADEISSIGIKTFKRSGKDWVEHFNNQILTVLNTTNDVQTWEEMSWLMSVYLMAEGEAPILLNNSKNPTQMVLLNPNKITIKFDNNEIIKEYIYTKSDGRIQTIPKDLIVFVKLPSVHSPFRGTGMMKHIAETLDIDYYIEKYLIKFFFNDATPGSVVETDKELSQVAYDRLQLLLKTKHQGVKKAHKNLILEGGLKWKDVGIKLSELQIKDLSDSVRDKVLAAFKVPKSILGITEDVNRANGETSDRVFAKRCIRPKLKLIQAQINKDFVSKFSDGKNYWFEFQNPVKEDELIQAQVDNIYVQAGIWTKNEVRARMEMPPLEEDTNGGDPGKDPNAEDGDAGQKHYNPGMINRFKGLLLEEKKEDAPVVEKSKDVFVDLMKNMLDHEEKQVKKEFTSEELDGLHKDKIAKTDPIEDKYKKVLSEYFTQQEGKVLSAIKSYKRKDVSINLSDDDEAELMAEISVPFIEESVITSSELAYALVGLDDERLSTQDDLVREFIKNRTLKLGQSTSETTRQDLERIMQGWAEDEGTIEDLKKMLAEYFDTARSGRVDMIARTEISRAAGFAQETVYNEVGAVGKQWITAQDERTCEFCGEMDGKVVGITENYWDNGQTVVGSEGGQLPIDFDDISSPPLHPSCRCDLIPIFEEAKISDAFKIKNAKEFKRLTDLEKKEKAIEKTHKKLLEKEKKIDKKIKEEK